MQMKQDRFISDLKRVDGDSYNTAINICADVISLIN